MIRYILTIVTGLLALMFWAITLTVPVFAATSPAIIAIFLTVVSVFCWIKLKPKETDKTKTPAPTL